MFDSKRVSIAPSIIGAICVACASGAHADDNDSGPYVGAAYGQFDVTIETLEGVTDAVKDLSTDSDAYKFFFGWRLNPYISLEADYIDLGRADGGFDASGTSGKYKLEMSGFGAYAIGTLPLGIFELSGKLGYYFHDVTVDVDLDNIGPGNGDVLGTDDSGDAFAYGVGAGVTLFDHLNTKIEYEAMDIDDLEDPYTIWLTAAWRF